MRVMVRMRSDTEKSSQAVRSGELAQIIGRFMERTKPEAAYFTIDEGKRTSFFIIDMQKSSEMPPLFEEAFMKLGAEIQVTPVMKLEELREGFSQIPRD
jgi:hypothetical protein